MKEMLSVMSIVGFIVISVLVLIAAKFGGEWAKGMLDTIVPIVIQTWIINITTMFNYYYGSSAGSQRKTDIIATQVEMTKPIQ